MAFNLNWCDLITAKKSLDVTKARGLDGLTPKIFKPSAEIIAPALIMIMIISLLNGQLSEPFKLAKIKLIQKGDPKSHPSNYRPISVFLVL